MQTPRLGDLPRGVERMTVSGNRAIWQFNASRPFTKYPMAEGSEFPGNPTQFNDWERFLSGGPGVISGHPWWNQIHVINQFPSWEHATHWLTEDVHEFTRDGNAPWLAIGIGSRETDPRYWYCGGCGVWRPHTEGR